MNFFVAFLAALFDRFIPGPIALTRLIGHPVVWQGKFIDIFDLHMNKDNQSKHSRRLTGTGMVFLLLVATLIVSLLLLYLLSYLPYSWVFEALLASSLLAHKSLKDAVQSVREGLQISLEQGRANVSQIVGRDTAELDEHEISRAAIESLAENSSDGVIAPLFYLALFGLPGIALYKAINTADSMVGHKNTRFEDFGWASAKLDDVVNWIPARLTAMFYALAANVVIKSNPTNSTGSVAGSPMQNSWHAALRDAPKHVSPNAGWPEAAMAGALDFGLGGSRAYQGKILHLAQMGSGRRDLISNDIARALKFYAAMTAIAMTLVGIGALFQYFI